MTASERKQPQLERELQALRSRVRELEHELAAFAPGREGETEGIWETSQVAEGFQVLSRVADAFTRSTSLTDAFDGLLDAVCQFKEIDSGGVLLVNEEEDCFELIAHKGVQQPFIDHVASIDFDSERGRNLLREKTLYIQLREENQERFHAELEEGLHSYIITPVIFENYLVAELILGSHSHPDISWQTRRNLAFIASHISSAVERQRIYAALQEREASFASFFHSLEDYLFVIDMTGRIVLANRAVENMGFLLEEIQNHSITTLYPQSHRTDIESIIRESQTASRLVCEIPMQANDGELIPVRSVFSHGRLEEQQVLLINSRDLTERELTSQKLRHQEEQYREIFGAVSDSLIICDRRGKVVDANLAACEMYMMAYEEIIGIDIKKIVSPEHFEGMQTLFTSGIHDIFELEAKNTRSDGSVFDAELRGSFFNFKGELHVLAVVRDISERKRIDTILTEKEQRMELALLGGDLSLWDVDLSTEEVFFDDRWASMFSYTRDEVPRTISEWNENIHPDDQRKVLECRRAHLAGETPRFLCEYRMRTKADQWKWIFSRGLVVERDKKRAGIARDRNPS